MEDSLAALCAGLICVVLWGGLAAIAGGLGHLRMKRVEVALGRRAEPTAERVQLFYAGAAVVWLSAAILSLVGLARSDWTRSGRNCLFIFVAHITVVIIGVPLVMPDTHSPGPPNVVPILVLACTIVAASALVASFFAVRWSMLRTTRIEGAPKTGAEPIGGARYGIYLASLLLWPVGLVSTLVLNKPENVRVGATSFVLSLVQLLGTAQLVCLALPLLAHSWL